MRAHVTTTRPRFVNNERGYEEEEDEDEEDEDNEKIIRTNRFHVLSDDGAYSWCVRDGTSVYERVQECESCLFRRPMSLCRPRRTEASQRFTNTSVSSHSSNATTTTTLPRPYATHVVSIFHLTTQHWIYI